MSGQVSFPGSTGPHLQTDCKRRSARSECPLECGSGAIELFLVGVGEGLQGEQDRCVPRDLRRDAGELPVAARIGSRGYVQIENFLRRHLGLADRVDGNELPPDADVKARRHRGPRMRDRATRDTSGQVRRVVVFSASPVDLEERYAGASLDAPHSRLLRRTLWTSLWILQRHEPRVAARLA